MGTCMLAIGHSDQDHTHVINHFIKELNDLNIGRLYWYNRMEHIAFDMIAYSADRPERQTSLH